MALKLIQAPTHIRVGDMVQYRPCFGMDPPVLARVESLEPTSEPRSKFSIGPVEQISVGEVDANRCLFILGDKWAYSEQINTNFLYREET